MLENNECELDQRIDIHDCSSAQLVEIASYIKADTLEEVNRTQIAPQIQQTFYTKYIKRLIDITVSGAALLVSAPINLIIGAVTFFDVGRPLFFKQTRVGKDRKHFHIYKFRNMTNATDARGELLPPAERVTKWGKFVRKTSLDELLNFLSIFKGDMSLIGPRPMITTYADRMHCRHLKMYAVKPGLECPFHQDLDHAPTWQDRLDNYVWYAENVSFLVDVKLAWRMVKLVFSKESTAQRSVSSGGAFLGYDKNGQVIVSTAVPQKYVDMYLQNHQYRSLEEAINDRYEDPVQS